MGCDDSLGGLGAYLGGLGAYWCCSLAQGADHHVFVEACTRGRSILHRTPHIGPTTHLAIAGVGGCRARSRNPGSGSRPQAHMAAPWAAWARGVGRTAHVASPRSSEQVLGLCEYERPQQTRKQKSKSGGACNGSADARWGLWAHDGQDIACVANKGKQRAGTVGENIASDACKNCWLCFI